MFRDILITTLGAFFIALVIFLVTDFFLEWPGAPYGRPWENALVIGAGALLGSIIRPLFHRSNGKGTLK